MRRSMLAVCALSVVATLGCDKIKDMIAKRRGTNRTPATAVHAATDTTKKPAPAAPTGAAAQAPTTKHPTPGATGITPSQTMQNAPPVTDKPYSSPDTGTVAPGMSERDVYSLWGPPADVRKSGEWTYLHYPNGCERTCGTDDVVMLQNGQVVDAIVRWPGHAYSGQSSSPPPPNGRKPAMTPPSQR